MNMRRHVIPAAIAAIALLTGCQKGSINESNGPERTILGVTHVQPDTRTYLGEGVSYRQILWKGGDHIIVNSGNMQGAPGLVDQKYDGKSSAVIPLESYFAPPYNVLYPAEVMSTDGTILIDEVQQFVADNVANGVAVSAGYSMSDDISLKCLYGFIKITLQQKGSESIRSLTLSSTGGEALAGIFDVDYETPSLHSVSGKDFIRIEDITYTSSKAEIVISVPAGSYEGFRIRILSDDTGDNMMQAQLTKPSATVNVLAGTMVDMGLLQFNPNSHANEIVTAEQFSQFLSAVSAGDYSAYRDEKSGEVLIGCDLDFTGINLPKATVAFDGILNGQGHSFMNLTTDKAMFTELTGTIKNIVFDESCTYDFPVTSSTSEVRSSLLVEEAKQDSQISGIVCRAVCPAVHHATIGRHFFGLLAARSSGVIRNCINYTDIDITVDEMKAAVDIALMVGAQRYTYSFLEECVNFGNLSLTVTGADKNLYLGGIVSVFTASTVRNCRNHGNVTYNYSSTGTGLPCIGGVAGGNGSTSKCTLQSCVNTGNVTVTATDKIYRPYVGGVIGSGSAAITSCRNEGTITVSGTYCQYTSSGTTYYPTIGGVIGINGDSDHARTVSGCENTGNVIMNSTPASATYSRGAGIAGLNYGTTTGCLNKGNITIADSGKDHYAAGIVGLTTGIVCTITSCRNEGTIYATTTAGAGCTLLLGGIVGRERGANISSCTNVGEIHAENGQINAGGIAGMLLVATTHSISECVNDGAIIAHGYNSSSTDTSVRAGGIVGYASKYSTTYTIDKCTNNADISVRVGGSNILYRIGGIIGYGACANVTSCVNNGQVTVTNDADFTTTRLQYMGGIVGYPCEDDFNIKGITDCTNNGKVQDLGQGTVAIGGIVAANYIKLSNPGRNYGEVYAREIASESMMGGISGLCRADIENAWSQGPVRSESAADVYVGGIAGRMYSSAAITGGYLRTSVSTPTGTPRAGLVLGKQESESVTVTIGSETSKLMFSEESRIMGEAPSNPPTKEELVGNIAGESSVNVVGIEVAKPTTGLISYDEAATAISGQGGSGSLFVSIGSEDVTVAASSTGWLRFGSSTPSSAKANTSITISYATVANFFAETRSCTVRIQGVTSGTYQDIVFTQANGDWVYTQGETFALPARWVFGPTSSKKYSETWASKGYYGTSYGNNDSSKTGGYVTYVRSDENEALCPIQRSLSSNGPALTNISRGDYWLVAIPAVTAEAGSWFEFYITATGTAKSPKYFILEWKDGNEWKHNEDRLYTAEEDPSLKYSYTLSGNGESHSTTFENAIQITKALNNETVYIRMRPVGIYAADGSIHNVSNTVDAVSGFQPANYSGIYFNRLVGPRPSVRKKVLFIGNSLTFYYTTIAKTKQLCWTQGLEIDAEAYLHGGAVFYEHMGWDFSKYVMARGGYDYAVLQCGARSISRYGRYVSPSGSDIDADEIAYCHRILKGYDDIQKWVLAYSPSCQLILEKDWRTKANADNYVSDYNITAEGYTVSEENRLKVHDIYIDRGHAAWAEMYPSVWESPVGDSFRYVWDESGWGYDLFHTDKYHENNDGAYLKACVNTLMLLNKKKFDQNIIEVDAVTPTMGKNFRDTAEHVMADKTYF